MNQGDAWDLVQAFSPTDLLYRAAQLVAPPARRDTRRVKSAPINQFRPTLEQAARIQQAVAAASLMTPERAEELQDFEMVCRQTGDGIPEPAMESVINVILGRKEPRHVNDLPASLFGSQPEGMFEAIGQFAAISALMEYLALDLLSTLIDDTPARSARQMRRISSTRSRCSTVGKSAQSSSVRPYTRRSFGRQESATDTAVAQPVRAHHLVALCGRLAFAEGPASRLLITEEEEGERLPDLAEEAAQEAVWLRDLIQRCQTEQNRRLAP